MKLLPLILLTVLSATGHAATPEDWKTYSGKYFSIKYPPDWKILEAHSGIKDEPPELENLHISFGINHFLVSRRTQKADIVDLANSKKSTDSKYASGPGKQGRLVHSEMTKLQGHDTYRCDFVRGDIGGELTDMRVVALGTAGNLLVLTSRTKDNDESAKIFDTMRDSIVIKLDRASPQTGSAGSQENSVKKAPVTK